MGIYRVVYIDGRQDVMHRCNGLSGLTWEMTLETDSETNLTNTLLKVLDINKFCFYTKRSGIYNLPNYPTFHPSNPASASSQTSHKLIVTVILLLCTIRTGGKPLQSTSKSAR